MTAPAVVYVVLERNRVRFVQPGHPARELVELLRAAEPSRAGEAGEADEFDMHGAGVALRDCPGDPVRVDAEGRVPLAVDDHVRSETLALVAPEVDDPA